MSGLSEIKEVLGDMYRRLFVEEWPSLAGGVLIGVLCIVSFTWARPWGVVGGLRVWGDWLFYGLGLYGQRPPSVLADSNSLITLGLVWGALAAALIARTFAIRVPPRLELIKAVVGGTLLGVGAALAGGCNVGGFFSAISALSLSGFAMMFGLLAGAWLGLKYLYWEMEHLPTGGGASGPKRAGGFDFNPIKTVLGWGLVAACLAAMAVYRSLGMVVEGGILVCGLGFGFVLMRSRLCFARAFREPFMTGEAKITQVVIIALMISVVGFAIIKWSGLRSEMSYVSPNFGLGGLLGGFVFGFGMLITGGCGSGTAWRACEGQVKLMLALVVFALANSLSKAAMRAYPPIERFVGTRVFLPDHLGYGWAVLAILAVLAVWYLAVAWNERTEKFVVDM